MKLLLFFWLVGMSVIRFCMSEVRMTHPLYEKAMTLARTYRSSESELLGTLVEMAQRNLATLFESDHRAPIV